MMLELLIVGFLTIGACGNQDGHARHSPPDIGITAFNCNDTKLDVITYDLNRVEECQIPANITVSERRIKVQVIQKKEMDSLMVKRCHVIEHTLAWHCGMHSHTSLANFDISPRPVMLTPNECIDAHATGRISLDGYVHNQIRPNTTNIVTITLAGSVWGEGECTGGTITTGGYTYKNVVFKRSYHVTLYEQLFFYKTGTQEVISFGGVSCKLTDGSCYDHEVGRIIWTLPRGECLASSYESLYAGQASLVKTSKIGPNDQYIRITSGGNGKFQLFTPLLRYEPLCGLDGWATPYHGLYVIQYSDSPPFPLNGPLTPNIDLIRYVETKFMTFAYGSAYTLSEIIQQISLTQCRTYRETLLNRLHIISTTPSSANLLVNNKPGIYGRVAGEVVHILQCPPVQVQLRRSTLCTVEIPVLLGDEKVWMDPRTRIITPEYTVTECSALTPVMFRHGDSWIKMTPSFSPATTPKVISPEKVPDFEFQTYASYAHGGIYDPQDLQKLREFMLFSARRESMSSNILHSVEGKIAPRYDLTQALNPTAWESLAKDRLKQMWGNFQMIGEVISGFLGIYFCLILLKYAVSIIIRCFNIYQITGLSWNLLAAIWSCCTQYILTTYKKDSSPSRSATQASAPIPEEVPLQPVNPASPRDTGSAHRDTTSLYPTVRVF